MNELTIEQQLSQVKRMLQEQSEQMEQMEQSIKGAVLAGSKHILTLEEAARYLGIAKSTLYKIVGRREISYHKVSGGDKSNGDGMKKSTGGRLFFRRDDLDMWMEGTRVPSEREVMMEAQEKHLRKVRK